MKRPRYRAENVTLARFRKLKGSGFRLIGAGSWEVRSVGVFSLNSELRQAGEIPPELLLECIFLPGGRNVSTISPRHRLFPPHPRTPLLLALLCCTKQPDRLGRRSFVEQRGTQDFSEEG